MFELGIGEMLVIAIVIVVLFGPDKLPSIARDLGQGVRKMKGAVEDMKTEIMKEVDNPVSEIKKEIEKVKTDANPLQDINNTLAETKEEVEKLKPWEDPNYKGPVNR
jgi:twin arginine-targeting protein translocase tatB